MTPAYLVLDLAGKLLAEAFDRKSAILSAEWFRAAGTPCIVRAA